MHNLETKLQNIIDIISSCAKKLGAEIYLYKYVSAFLLTGNEDFLKPKIVHIVICPKQKFDHFSFVQDIKSTYPISILDLSCDNLVCRIDRYEVHTKISYTFDPMALESVENICQLKNDAIFYSADYNEINNTYKLNQNNILNIEPVTEVIDYSTFFQMCEYFGLFHGCTSVGSKKINQNIFSSSTDLIQSILHSLYPGSALTFIHNNVQNGDEWLFEQLKQFSKQLGSQAESHYAISVFSEEKLSLINTYAQSAKNINGFSTLESQRVVTENILRVLLNSTNISIAAPYLDKVTAFSGSTGRCCFVLNYYSPNPPDYPTTHRLTSSSHRCIDGILESQCNEEYLFSIDEDIYQPDCSPSDNPPCQYLDVGHKWCPDIECVVAPCDGPGPLCPSPCDEPSNPLRCGYYGPPAPGPGITARPYMLWDACICSDLGGNYCPDGNCSGCRPSECIADGGDACCCCHSVDIVNNINARCYDKIYFSCNRDGTAPGPPSDLCECEDFAESCDQCFEACEMALEINGRVCSDIYGGHGSPPDWWDFPPDVGPCECFCAQPDATGCNLTCVTCQGLTCTADVNILSNNCSYQFVLTPGVDCCGVPHVIEVIVIFDLSSASSGFLSQVQTELDNLFDLIESNGFSLQVGLVSYGSSLQSSGSPKKELDLTSTITDFQTAFSSLVIGGDTSPAFTAVEFAAQMFEWSGNENLILLISNSDTECSNCEPATGEIGESNKQPSAENLAKLLEVNNIYFNAVDSPDTPRQQLINLTGGSRQTFGTEFGPLVFDDLHLPSGFGSSCDCLNYEPVYAEVCLAVDNNGNCTNYSNQIPIRKCVEEDNSDCRCTEPYVLEICGETIIVEPDPNTINLICCHEIEGGCSCPPTTNPPEGCCGVNCRNLGNLCELYHSQKDAVDDIWCECWEKAQQGIDGFLTYDVNCTSCVVPDTDHVNYQAIVNCCIRVPNGSGGYNFVCRSDIEQEVAIAWATCSGGDPPRDDDGGRGDDGGGGGGDGGGGEPPTPNPIWTASCSPTCERDDECIVANQAVPNNCSTAHEGCESIQNPSVVVLNNGIGIVAYESLSNNSVIQLQQFHTSLKNKILPNRETNFGRLQNSNQWSGTPQIAKLYYYDELLPIHFLHGIAANSTPDLWQDSIAFKNGPLEHQCFPLFAETNGHPYGEDSVGKYIQFIVEGITLSNNFPSSDDVYDVQWFITDSADSGLIGDTIKNNETPGSDFLIDSRADIDQILQLPSHIHNGVPVPVANPSIATLNNYMNYLENSHMIYVAYQAYEDSKWNIYVRQLRLSEYSKSNVLSDAPFITLSEAGISDVVGRVICVNNSCVPSGDQYSTTRSITMQVVLPNGQEVFNDGFDGIWSGLCPGLPDEDFPKQNVFIQFYHTVITSVCPTQFELQSIFYDWNVGDEFSIPASNISPSLMFQLLKKADDTSVEIGVFSNPLSVGSVSVYSSSVSVVWYDNPESSNWVVPNSQYSSTALQFKGADIAEPIPISNTQQGHATRPIIKNTLNNDICIVYESTEEDITQIHIASTTTPSSSLPLGVFRPINIDRNLDYFLSPNDFTYRQQITQSSHGVNQLPDMFIDANDVVHLAWQSNKDGYWEIYYANSESAFQHKRITNYKSKSLKPKIAGDHDGRLFITWHDNRFGGWEVMLAYYPGIRVRTLIEQDPYLASVRNYFDGYRHAEESCQLAFSHSVGRSICFNDVIVNFYTDRLHENLLFSLSKSIWPMAIQISTSQDDTTNEVFNNVILWDYVNNGDGTATITSPEFNTSLISSVVQSLIINYATVTGNVLIAFRGSNEENVVSSWTPFADITSVTSGAVILYSTLDLANISGLYKQIRLNVSTAEILATTDIEIAADDDDIYYTGSTPQSDMTLAIGYDHTTFLRFPVNIPKSSKIISSTIAFKSNTNNSSSNVNLKISLLNSDDASDLDFSDPILTGDDETTETYIEWNSVESWEIDLTYESVDISSLIQEYINRLGYSASQYIGIKIEDFGSSAASERSAYDIESLDIPPTLSIEYIDGSDLMPLTITSVSSGRFCVPANTEVVGTLDLTPTVRIDKHGTDVTESPLPVGFVRNKTYFFGIQGVDEEGNIVDFNDPKISISCETCSEEQIAWNEQSCSYSVNIQNFANEERYFNARIMFFADQERQDLIYQFDAFNSGDLQCFSVNGNNAQSNWGESGFRLDSSGRMFLTVWPLLSGTHGLLCGVKYWVETQICSTTDAENGCNKTDLSFYSIDTWFCNCNSERWIATEGDSPSNIRNIIRWLSSGDKNSDTRITETLGSNNMNPSIKVRSNGNGVIVYQTNRNDPDKLVYEVYSSVFSVYPAYNMYASAAQSIISPFDELLIKSDIPICANSGCNENNLTLQGRNISFDFDQYDNIFMAFEQQYDQAECNQFKKNKQQIVKVHRCGLDAENLIFNRETNNISPSAACLSPEILNKIAPISEDSTFRSVIQSARVDKNFVVYHVTQNNTVSAVVNNCSVKLEIICEPETIAVRLRNESEQWSQWFAVAVETGNNTMVIPWILSSGSGTKFVNVQGVTYQGVSSEITVSIIADYAPVKYQIRLYKSANSSPLPPFSDSIFVSNNSLPLFNSVPVAGIGKISIQNNSIVSDESAVVFVEIIPSQQYLDLFSDTEKSLNQASPIFDLIQQGYNDQFGLATYYSNTGGFESFRGSFVIEKDNNGNSKDGTSFIVPHFKKDCSDSSVSGVSSAITFSKNLFNTNKSGIRKFNEDISEPVFDLLEDSRNSIGQLKTKVDIRPNEDPYFIFGDPNYRMETNN